MEHLKDFGTTLIALFFALGLLALAAVFDLDLFESLAEVLRSLDHYELDEILLAGLLLLLGFLVDTQSIRRRKVREVEVQEQRLRVLKATMTSVQDIVNNFLNNLLLFRLEAEEQSALTPESLQLMDTLIEDATRKLKRLATLEATPEKQMPGGFVGIDYNGLLPRG